MKYSGVLISLVISMICVLQIKSFQQHSKHHNPRKRFCDHISNLKMKLEYRNAKDSDIASISELCSESFDGPFQWHQQIQKIQSIDSFKVQLKDRLSNLVAKGAKHSMIVAIDSEQSEKYAVVGFLEVGLLPSPIGMKETLIVRDDLNIDVTTVILEDGANLDTDESTTKLLMERDNKAALDPVERTTANGDVTKEEAANPDFFKSAENLQVNIQVSSVGFTDSSADDQTVDQNQLILAAAALEAEQKLKKRKEDVPYLGNVAVSKDCRRQGVGMKLVKIGLKVAQKWGDSRLFVVVESDNYGAIKMYEKLKFVCVMKEEDNINRRMDRLPRIFMALDVPVAKPKEEVAIITAQI